MEDQFVHKRLEKMALGNQKKIEEQHLTEGHEDSCDHQNFSSKIKEKLDHFIGSFKDSHHWLQDNQFIKSGYRINFNTPKKVFKSLFMIHNELVNVWTHLAGAIVLIIIFIFLCFSVSSYDPTSLKMFVSKEANQYFESLYSKFPNFTQIEVDLTTKIDETKKGFSMIAEHTMENLEESYNKLSVEIETIKTTLSSESLKIYMNDLKVQIDKLPEIYDELKYSIDSQVEKKLDKAKEITESLKTKLQDLEKEIIKKSDSSDWDWIDVYKYLNNKPNLTMMERSANDPNHLSRWPIFVFLISALCCLLGSAVFHLFCCLNLKTNKILQRLDYAGISFLISGSTFPGLVYGFQCEPFYYQLYTSIIGVACLLVFFVSLGDWIHQPENSKAKAFMYGGLGIFAVFPFPHLAYNTLQGGPNEMEFISSIPYYILMGASYLIGLSIYSAKCPEKYKPGKYDICGHSHQLWHIFVLAGIFWTYLYSFDHYYSRKAVSCVIN